MESIIYDGNACYICGAMRDLETHHCLHGSRRKKAEEDGLTVKLCHSCHMRLHDTGKYDRDLQQAAQVAYMARNGGVNAFVERYGKNYL